MRRRLISLGEPSASCAHFPSAHRVGEEALQFLEKAHDSFFHGVCCGLVLGKAALRAGHYEEAKQYYLRSVNCFKRLKAPFEEAQSNRELGEVYALLKEYDSAKQAYQSSMGYYAKAGPQAFVIGNLQAVSRVFEMQGQYARAVELLALLSHHPAAFKTDIHFSEATLADLRATLSAEDFRAAYERGKALDLEVVVAELLQDAY